VKPVKRWLRAVAACGIALFVLLGLVLAASRTERGARTVIALIGRASGFEIDVQALHVAGWRWTAEDLRVAVAGGEGDLFRARRATVGLTPASLLRSRAYSVAVDEFELDVAHVPVGEGGGMRIPFEELRAVNGVVRHVSATIEEIRIPEIVFARAEQSGAFDIRGRLESGDDLRIAWSGSAAANGGDVAVRVEGALRNVERLLHAPALLGADSSSTLSFAGELSGELGADLHASAVAELGVAALRAPVRAVIVLDRSGASGDLSYVVDVNGEGVAAPLKLAGLLRQRSGAAAHELTARWRDLQVAEVASLLRDRSRFDARAGLVNLDASVSGALGAPAVGVTVDVSDLAATAGTVTITGTGALSFLYSGGALASRDRGLTLDNLEISTPTMKSAVKHLRAEPAVDGDSPTRSLRFERLAANGVAFTDTGHELQASGVEVSGRLVLASDTEQSRTATLALTAPRGEILYKLTYLDIAASPAELSLRITSKDTSWTGDGSVKLADLGEVRANGDYDGSTERRRLHLEVEVPRLRAPFERLVRDTFSDAYPMLAQTTLTGAASVDVEVRTAGADSSATGRIRLRDVAVDVEAPSLHGKGITLDLPIALSTGGGGDGNPASGQLRIGEAAFGDAMVGAVDLPLMVRANEIAAAAPLPISIAQGVVLIEGLRAHSLTSDAPALEGRVGIKDLALADLTAAAGLPRVDGRVNGSLGLVRIADGRLTTDAAIDVGALGGNVHLADISMHELFSRVPALSFDAVLSHIDLGEATKAIGVGEVSGIAEGEINDLEIAAGAPVRFDARFESVPAAGVAQRISVTAIDQLAVLGGGASGSVARGMMGSSRVPLCQARCPL
jgi:hypothetical protein